MRLSVKVYRIFLKFLYYFPLYTALKSWIRPDRQQVIRLDPQSCGQVLWTCSRASCGWRPSSSRSLESALESGEDVFETLRREFARSRVSRCDSRLTTRDSQMNGRPAGSLQETNSLESSKALPPQRLSPLAAIVIDLLEVLLPLLPRIELASHSSASQTPISKYFRLEYSPFAFRFVLLFYFLQTRKEHDFNSYFP